MENKEEMLKKLGLKTMFNITDAEMPVSKKNMRFL